MFYVPLCFHSYLIDGAESSSESDMDEDNKSDEEVNIKVQCVFFLRRDRRGKTDLSYFNVLVILMLFSH